PALQPYTTLFRRLTPVVVSSLTPLIPAARRAKRPGDDSIDEAIWVSRTLYSSGSSLAAVGTPPAASHSVPLSTYRVASPPSSRMRFAPSGKSKIRSAAHQYSSSVSPLHANTGTPAGASGVPEPTTTAAAASSWVEKILQLAHRTSAPRATRVSMSTAVWTVMCRLPAMRAPVRGADEEY